MNHVAMYPPYQTPPSFPDMKVVGRHSRNEGLWTTEKIQCIYEWPTDPLTYSGGAASKTSIQPLQGMLLTTLISHASQASLICCSQKYRIKDQGMPHCATKFFPTVPTQPAPVFRHHVRGSGCPTRRKRRLDPCNVTWQDILTLKTSGYLAFRA